MNDYYKSNLKDLVYRTIEFTIEKFTPRRKEWSLSTRCSCVMVSPHTLFKCALR